MLAIRLQRRGRKGHAQFRVIVQDSRLSPKSGKVVAAIGSFDPHTKESQLDKEKAEFYLGNGAQPSQRVIKLFKDQKIKLPEWAELDTTLKGSLKNPEKLRKNQPAEPEQETEPEAPAAAEEAPEETTEDEKKSAAAEEAKESEKADEEPAKEATESEDK